MAPAPIAMAIDAAVWSSFDVDDAAVPSFAGAAASVASEAVAVQHLSDDAIVISSRHVRRALLSCWYTGHSVWSTRVSTPSPSPLCAACHGCGTASAPQPGGSASATRCPDRAAKLQRRIELPDARKQLLDPTLCLACGAPLAFVVAPAKSARVL